MGAEVKVAVKLVLLVGLIGQVLALRLLAIQLARGPEDPPLLRHHRAPEEVARRRQRHRRLTALAIGGFTVATLLASAGVVGLLA